LVAYNSGDYVPAIRLFRPLAEQGNPKAQGVLGPMHRKARASLAISEPGTAMGMSRPICP
jgi:hypothetical protein